MAIQFAILSSLFALASSMTLSPSLLPTTPSTHSPTHHQTKSPTHHTTKSPSTIQHTSSPTTVQPTTITLNPTTPTTSTASPTQQPTASPTATTTSSPTTHRSPPTHHPSVPPSTLSPTRGPFAGGCTPNVNGHVYNFTTLRNVTYQWTDLDMAWQYSFTFCGAPSCGHIPQSTLCQTSTFLPLSYSLGTWKDNQIWRDGGDLNHFTETSIQTTFLDGSFCELTNSSRTTTIYLLCRPNITTASLINVTSSPSACSYTALVAIPYSLCPPPPVVPEPLLNAWQISLIVVGSMFVLGAVAFVTLREAPESGP